MYLLITQAEYSAHSGLPGVTGSHTNHTINGTGYVHCTITNQVGYAQIEANLDQDAYTDSDTILLPPEAFEK